MNSSEPTPNSPLTLKPVLPQKYHIAKPSIVTSQISLTNTLTLTTTSDEGVKPAKSQ
ncbi:hypothetical protein GcC1_137017 [Golovinomyces cichoracearum]|uniref:Uncharacterized protein n=1 Tax=Golovinomyces cichoracearum TaxID=62708 RepID=A0A420I1Z6_9PEZI|nr:hypothetical protein GcC1_137017 [Golovinomyces cichoracearum]